MNQTTHQEGKRKRKVWRNVLSRFPNARDKAQHFRSQISWLTEILYAFLFSYTGYSKLSDIGPFTKGISKTPIFGHYAGIIAYGVPILEIVLAFGIVMPFRRIKHVSLALSVVLLGIFTVYLIVMILFVKEKLCHCGGVIGSMGWTHHLVFNLVFLLLGLWAIKKKRFIDIKKNHHENK